jgi:hypothetical protein
MRSKLLTIVLLLIMAFFLVKWAAIYANRNVISSATAPNSSVNKAEKPYQDEVRRDFSPKFQRMFDSIVQKRNERGSTGGAFFSPREKQMIDSAMNAEARAFWKKQPAKQSDNLRWRVESVETDSSRKHKSRKH